MLSRFIPFASTLAFWSCGTWALLFASIRLYPFGDAYLFSIKAF